MPTNDRLSLAAPLAWLRAQVDRLRRAMMARRPVVRWGAASVALIGVISVVYWAATSLNTLGVRHLLSGRHLSSDDLIKVCSTLDKQQVLYRVDDLRRVEVAADQYEQAAAVVAKLDLGPRSLGEIREQSIMSYFLDTPADKERRWQLSSEKMIEGLIGELDGVVWSLVSINRPQAAKWVRPSSAVKPTAFIYIETEGNRQLSYQTVQSIHKILVGREPDLTLGSITLMDRRGKSYLEPGNLAIGDSLRNRAREEELVQKILDKLDWWIKGVRVQVKVSSPATAVPAPSVAGATNAPRQPGSAEFATAARTGDGTLRSEPGGSTPAMIVNKATSLEPDPSPRLPPASPSIVANATTATNPSDGGRPGEHEKKQKHEPGRVLIYVPRSFYLNADIRADNREPTRDELRTMADRTENQIRTAVGLITPESESWKIDIFTIPDEVSLSRPAPLQSPVDARRRVLDWGIVGTVVAVVSILAAAGSWIKAARRPVVLPESAVTTRRYHVDSASEPGPSERVRELVRRNPEAAASVLQRWTGQGGRA